MGFRGDSNNNQVDEYSKNIDYTGTTIKIKTRAAQTLIPVTIKQLKEAVNTSGEIFTTKIKSREFDISQISVVGCIRSVVENDEFVAYSIEDGSGSITARIWQSSTGSFSETLRIDTWVKIHGILRSFADKRSLQIHQIRPITDFNEITLHFLQVIQSSSTKLADSFADIGHLSPAQKIVLNFYRSNSHFEQGLHKSHVISALSGRLNPKEVESTISWLQCEALIYTTIDSDHAKPLLNN